MTAVVQLGHNSAVLLSSSWRRFARLSVSDQLAALEAMVAVGGARALVSFLPQARVGQLLRPLLEEALPRIGVDDAALNIAVQRVRAAVRRASARVPGATCLVQAIAGWSMLKARGVAAQVRIGVDKADESFSAHAWLIVGDTVVLGGADAAARFVVLESR